MQKKLLQTLNLKGSVLLAVARKKQSELAWNQPITGSAKAVTRGPGGEVDEGRGYRKRTW